MSSSCASGTALSDISQETQRGLQSGDDSAHQHALVPPLHMCSELLHTPMHLLHRMAYMKSQVFGPSLPDTVWDAQMEEEKKAAEGVEEAADTVASDTTGEPVVEAAAIQQQLNSLPAADKADKACPLSTACQHALQSFADAFSSGAACLALCRPRGFSASAVHQKVARVCYEA